MDYQIREKYGRLGEKCFRAVTVQLNFYQEESRLEEVKNFEMEKSGFEDVLIGGEIEGIGKDR